MSEAFPGCRSGPEEDLRDVWSRIGSGVGFLAPPRPGDPNALLPTYASESHKDPRAPQNRYPITGLGRQLRRPKGDPTLLERALGSAAAQVARAGVGR